MRKFKKVVALGLAMVTAVSLMFVGGKEEAKAGDNGFYAWYTTSTSNSFDIETFQWKEVGTPAVECENFITVENTNSSKTLGVTSPYGADTWGTCNGVTLGTMALKVGSNCKVVIAPTCSGTVTIYWAAKQSTTSSIKIAGGDVSEQYSYTDESAGTIFTMQENSFDVVAGTEYAVTRGGGEARLCMVEFTPAAEDETPNPIGAILGTSIREATAEHANGLRFGSTLDKTAANYADIKESGSLVALQGSMEEDSVAELTLDTVDTTCKKVVRTTYLEETDSLLSYAVAIVNIPDEAKDVVIVARPYVILNDGTVCYGEQMSSTYNETLAKVNAAQ